MKRAALAMAVVIAAWGTEPVPARAQEATPEEMAAWMEATSPGEHHAALEPLIGRWDHTVTIWMEPGAEPMEMSATSEARWILGDRYVVQEYEGTFAGMPFHGRDLVGYDNLEEKYFSIWIDNHSTGPMVTWGTYDAETRTLTMEGTYSDPMTGRTGVATRTVTRFADDGTVVYESYGPGPDGEMIKVMEVVSRPVE